LFGIANDNSSLVLLSQGNTNGAYDTCLSVFTKLGESIPSSVKPEDASVMLAETLTMYKDASEEDGWINTGVEDEKIRTVAKIYNKFVTTCYLCKQEHMAVYHMCRALQLSLQNGACQYTPLALVHFAGYSASKEESPESIW
jgi:hypothetical protein